MEIIQDIQFAKMENTCFFTYNTNGVVSYPQEVTTGNTAIFTKTPDLVPVEAQTMEELMVIYTGMGFTIPDPTQPVVVEWVYPDKSVRLFMTYKDYVALLASPYGIPMLEYFNTIEPLVVDTNEGKYIYLSELYDEHKVILEQYNCVVENKPETYTEVV